MLFLVSSFSLFLGAIFGTGSTLAEKCCLKDELEKFESVSIGKAGSTSIINGYKFRNHLEFRGIKYATSTRWQASILNPLLPSALAPVSSSATTAPVPLFQSLTPTENAPQCFQFMSFNSPFTKDLLSPPPNAKQSEDCLYLNIYTPDAGKIAPKGGWPVAVYIHGGSFKNGGNAITADDPSNWVDQQQDLIIVVPNYRLGIFGWMTLPDLENYPTRNQGMTDIINAFQWVHDHIGLFGGNPENVTMMGHSAGAIIVGHLLLALKDAKYSNLVHRAILASGTPFSLPERDCENSLNDLTHFSEGLGCFASGNPINSQKLIECLVGKKSEEIDDVMQQIKFKYTRNFSVITDGVLIKESPLELFRKGEFLKIPVLITTIPNDGSMFLPMKDLERFGKDEKTQNQYWMIFLFNYLVENPREKIMQVFGGENVPFSQFKDKAYEILTNIMFHVPSIKLARYLNEFGSVARYTIIPKEHCFDQTKHEKYEKIHDLKAFHGSDFNSLFAPRHRIRHEGCNMPVMLTQSSQTLQKAFGAFIKEGKYTFGQYVDVNESSPIISIVDGMNYKDEIQLEQTRMRFQKHKCKIMKNDSKEEFVIKLPLSKESSEKKEKEKEIIENHVNFIAEKISSFSKPSLPLNIDSSKQILDSFFKLNTDQIDELLTILTKKIKTKDDKEDIKLAIESLTDLLIEASKNSKIIK